MGYPEEWLEIANTVKDAAGWCCEHCGRPDDWASGRVLTVHHIDGVKSECALGNLVALCQRCHLHWQARYVPGQMVMDFALPEWLRRRGHGE